MTPGGQDRAPTIYLFTQDGCANCPAAKAVIHEAFDGSNVGFETVDLQAMDPDFEFKLLEHQVFIASTPSIIIENGGNLRLLYSGEVPTVEQIQREVLDAA
jgi:glutaredoxin